MNQLFKVIVIVVGFGMLPAAAFADTFMLIPGVAGDSTAKGHEGWIRLSSFEWGVQSSTTIGTATGGAGAGKATGKKFQLTVPAGIWSRELVNTLVRGAHYPQVVIDHVNPDGRPAYRVTIQTMFFTDYGNVPGVKAAAEDKFEGVHGGFRVEYFSVAADGRVTSSSVGWSFITNTEVK